MLLLYSSFVYRKVYSMKYQWKIFLFIKVLLYRLYSFLLHHKASVDNTGLVAFHCYFFAQFIEPPLIQVVDFQDFIVLLSFDIRLSPFITLHI